MQIVVKTLTNRTITLDVADTFAVGPIEKHIRRAPCGSKALDAAAILGRASGSLAKAAASTLAVFWQGAAGKAVRAHLANIASDVCEVFGQAIRRHEFAIEEAIVEFSRFVLLKCLSHDVGVPDLGNSGRGTKRKRSAFCQFSPSFVVDQVWHELLLFPKAYGNFCAELLGDGEIFDHDPRAARGACAARQERYSCTFKRYLEIFKEAPMRAIWGLPSSWLSDPDLVQCTDTLKGVLEQKEGIPTDQQRLSYGGKDLEDGQILRDCGLIEGATVDLRLRLRGC